MKARRGRRRKTSPIVQNWIVGKTHLTQYPEKTTEVGIIVHYLDEETALQRFFALEPPASVRKHGPGSDKWGDLLIASVMNEQGETEFFTMDDDGGEEQEEEEVF